MNPKIRVTTATVILTLVALAAPTFAQGPIGQDTCASGPIGASPFGALCTPVDAAGNAADDAASQVCDGAGLGTDCSQTPSPDTSALDALCGTLAPDAADPTIPNCLQDVSPPTVLPDGCDPTDATTLEACGVPQPDLSALTADCVQPAPGPTVAAEAQAYLTCVAGNAQATLLDTVGPITEAVRDAICGVFATATGTDAQDCADAFDAADIAYFTGVLTALVDSTVCGAIGTDGTTAQDCINENVPSECPTQAPGTFPQCTDLLTQQLNTVLHTVAPAQFNNKPVANAGADQSGNEGTTITLHGSGTDADSDPLTYAWSCPTGISLSSVTAQNPTFTAPAVGPGGSSYTCSLTVKDNSGSATTATSSPDSVVATVNDVAPAAPTLVVANVADVVAGSTFSVSGTVTGAVSNVLIDVTPPGGVAGAPTTVPVSSGAFSHSFASGNAGSYSFHVKAPLDAPYSGIFSEATKTGTASVNIVVSIDSLASQASGNLVQLTGTATANAAQTNVPIAIAVVGTPATGTACSGTPNIVWDGNFDHIDLAAGVAQGFNAYICWTTGETVTFHVTVGTGFSQDATVSFGGSGSHVTVKVSDVAATVAAGLLQPSASYLPDGALTSARSSVIAVTDGNGPGGGAGSAADGRINDANLAVSLANGADSVVLAQTAGADNGAIERDITVSTDLPANLKDGDYTLTASYTNWDSSVADPSTQTLTVQNAAPSITVTPATLTGSERVAGSGNIAITLVDANLGNLQGGAVKELTAFTVGIFANADCSGTIPVSGLSVGFTGLPADASSLLGTVDYSNALLSGGQTTLTTTVSWASYAVGNVYFVCATVSDGQATSLETPLATLTLTAINAGFHLTISDGGNGLQVATPIEPNAPATTSGLRVLLSGDQDAAGLTFSVGQFSDGVNSFTPADLSGTLCLTNVLADCTGAQLLGTAAGTAGSVDFAQGAPLTANLVHGVPVYAFFTFTVPNGTAASATGYTSSVTVLGAPA